MSKLIENLNLSNQERGIKETGHDLLTIKNYKLSGTRIGMDITSCKEVDIQDCDIGGQGTWGAWQYAYGIRLGFGGNASLNNGIVRISGSNIHDLGTPSGDYAKFNRDLISNEGGELWIKDSTLQGASDACIDGKGFSRLKNCKIGNSHRLLRLWSNNTTIVSGCAFTSVPSHSIVWFRDKTAKLIVHDCTFDGSKTLPLNKIEGEDMNPQEASSLVSYVTTDPLKDNPWFNTSVIVPPSNDAEILFHVKALAKLLKAGG